MKDTTHADGATPARKNRKLILSAETLRRLNDPEAQWLTQPTTSKGQGCQEYPLPDMDPAPPK